MDIEKLIKRLKCPQIQSCPMDGEYPSCKACQKSIQEEVTTALSTLQGENESLKEKLYDGEGVNLVDYWMQQAKIEENGHRNCQAENEKLRAENNMLRRMQPVELNGEAARSLSLALEASQLREELEQVKRERNAAVEDVAAIIGDVEEIRLGYDVGNADADGAFAVLCETYCANKGRFCYAEFEKYHCKNFKWRGIKKED